jgi:hypothetical protein
MDGWMDGWMDGVERDLRNLDVVNWKTKAQEQNGWRQFLEIFMVTLKKLQIVQEPVTQNFRTLYYTISLPLQK